MIHSFVLNPFPALLDFSFFAPLLLRVIAGVLFVRMGYWQFRTSSKERKALGIVEVLGGLALIAGFYTQIAVLVLGLVATIGTFRTLRTNEARSDTYALLLAIMLSLLATGAGAFALDLPL